MTKPLMTLTTTIKLLDTPNIKIFFRNNPLYEHYDIIDKRDKGFSRTEVKIWRECAVISKYGRNDEKTGVSVISFTPMGELEEKTKQLRLKLQTLIKKDLTKNEQVVR